MEEVETKAYNKAYYQANKERIKAAVRAYREANLDRVKAAKAAYYQANKERLKVKQRAYREAHLDEVKAKNKVYLDTPEGRRLLRQRLSRYKKSEKGKASEKRYRGTEARANVLERYRATGAPKRRHRERYHTDPSYKLSVLIRSRVRHALQGKYKPQSSIQALGCSVAELRAWLEAKFSPGMSWENHGKGPDKWHVDHIRPLAQFDLTDPDQFAKACHYSNLQPLWEPDNLSKGDRT